MLFPSGPAYCCVKIGHTQAREHRLARSDSSTFCSWNSVCWQLLKLRKNLFSMLIEQRRGTAHAHRRKRQTHRRARRSVFADHRMLDFLQPLARAILLAVDELADGVERRGGEMARLRLVGKIIGARTDR